MKYIIFIFSIFISSCTAQHSVETNEIFESAERKKGVKSSAGEVLIEPIYTKIIPMLKDFRLRLPPRSEREKRIIEPLEYYQVYDEVGDIAIFDANGKKVFDFCNCRGFQMDEHTQTIVAKSKVEGNGVRSKIYKINGAQLFEETFEEIAYINDSDLIALIKEDGAKDEFYLYNPFTKKRIGPYDHFNIYNKDFDPTMGIKTIEFEKFTDPLGISVRLKNTWGFVDMKGNEIHPMKFSEFRYLTAAMKKTYIALSEKPENVEFVFYARLLENERQLVFFDKKLNEYSFTRLESGGSKLELIKK